MLCRMCVVRCLKTEAAVIDVAVAVAVAVDDVDCNIIISLKRTWTTYTQPHTAIYMNAVWTKRQNRPTKQKCSKEDYIWRTINGMVQPPYKIVTMVGIRRGKEGGGEELGKTWWQIGKVLKQKEERGGGGWSGLGNVGYARNGMKIVWWPRLAIMTVKWMNLLRTNVLFMIYSTFGCCWITLFAYTSHLVIWRTSWS